MTIKDIRDKLGIRIEGLQIILSVRDMNLSRAFYKAPTNYSWAMEMQVEDPDGHVLRFGTDPNYNEPFVDEPINGENFK